MRASRWKLVVLLVVIVHLAISEGARAQKSLADGVAELATNLAKSYGEVKKGPVAILPLHELAGGENLLGAYIAETLTNSFFEVGYREIVERQMLDRAIQELKLTLTGMIDSDSAKKIGRFLNADFVVGGTLTDLGGEIAVNCRMFRVESGEIVAVATTKIVKDDSVKSMVTTGVGSSESAVQRALAKVAPDGVGEIIQEVEGISLRLKRCLRYREAVECEVSITALNEDTQIHLSRGSRLIDRTGRVTLGNLLSFGETIWIDGIDFGVNVELIRKVPLQGRFRFEGVELDNGRVPLIEIWFEFRGWSQKERVKFHGVKVE